MSGGVKSTPCMYLGEPRLRPLDLGPLINLAKNYMCLKLAQYTPYDPQVPCRKVLGPGAGCPGSGVPASLKCRPGTVPAPYSLIGPETMCTCMLVA